MARPWRISQGGWRRRVPGAGDADGCEIQHRTQKAWNRAVGNGIHFCDTTERAFQRLFIERGIPWYHRSGEKPLDPTTLAWNDSISW